MLEGMSAFVEVSAYVLERHSVRGQNQRRGAIRWDEEIKSLLASSVTGKTSSQRRNIPTLDPNKPEIISCKFKL